MMGPRQTAKADQKVDLNQRRLQLARTRGFTAPGAGEARRSAVADLSRSWIREVWDAATDGARTQGVALASVGSLARGDAGPLSDFDLVLLHDGRSLSDKAVISLADGPDAVVELRAGVPDRVPDAIGQGDDSLVRQRASVVQQHQVEVAEWSRIAAGQAADAGQRDPLRTSSIRCRVPDLTDPAAAQISDRRAACLAGTRGGEAPGAGELQASLVEVHLLVRLRSLSGSHHEFPPL